MSNREKHPEELVNDEEYGNELVDDELWDHYSGLPNPNWYAEYESSDDNETK